MKWKLVSVLTAIAVIIVGIVAVGRGDSLTQLVQPLGGGDLATLRAEAIVEFCDLDASDRAVEREAINTALPDDMCEVTTCPGDTAAACPRDTVLARTGQPAEVNLDAEVAVEKLKAEVEAQVREDVRDEVEAEVKAEAAAEAVQRAADEQ